MLSLDILGDVWSYELNVEKEYVLNLSCFIHGSCHFLFNDI